MNNSLQAPWYLLFCLFALSHSTETIHTAGLPAITKDMQISANLTQVTSSVYFLGFAIGIFIFGQISDKVGRRPTIILGLIIYLISSAACIISHNIYWLIGWRFAQALGASVGSVVAQSIARDCYRGTELSTLFATLSAGLAVMPALGSMIGSIIVSSLGWRFNFVFMFCAIFLVLIACWRKLPETNKRKGQAQFYKFKEVFSIIIRDLHVLCYALIIGCFNGILYSFYIEAPFIFIDKIGVSVHFYGLIILVLSAAGASGSLLSRYLLNKGIMGKTILKNSLIFSLVSCSTLVGVSLLWSEHYLDDIIILYILIPMICQGVCYSLIMPVVMRSALENYTKVNGTAGSIFNSTYYSIVCLINFITASLHSDRNIIALSILFMILSAVALVASIIINKVVIIRHKPLRDESNL